MLEPDEMMKNVSVVQREVFPFGARVAYRGTCANRPNLLSLESRKEVYVD